MNNNDYREVSDDKLVDIAGSTVIGTGSGLHAQKAQAELLRRNTEALRESKEAANRSSGIMFDLTLILMVIAIIQMIAGIFSLDIETYLKVVITIGVFGLLGLLFKDFISDWRRDKD